MLGLFVKAIGLTAELGSLWGLLKNKDIHIVIGLFVLSVIIVFTTDKWDNRREIQKELQKIKPESNERKVKSHSVISIIYNTISVILGMIFLAFILNNTSIKQTSFDGWWKETMNSDAVVCMLPFNATENVYPSINLDDKERDQEHTTDLTINSTDEINIISIEKKPDDGILVAYINYPVSGRNKRASGYIRLDKLVEIKSDETVKEITTNQSTRVFLRPKDRTDIRELTHIKPGEKVYLLGTCEEWQQILYHHNYHHWYLCWVKKEELVVDHTCTVKKDKTSVRFSPQMSNDSVTFVNKGEVYTIREVYQLPTSKTVWYKIHADGETGWINSEWVVRNESATKTKGK